MNKILLLCSLILCISCQKTEKNTTLDRKTLITPATATETISAKFSDTVQVNYTKNRELLELLPLLPETAMGSWEWSKEERTAMVKSIAAHNYFVDTTANFNTIKKILPHYFETQVVDGVWSYGVYKIDTNNYLVLTDDHVGDGSDVHAFFIKNGTPQETAIENLTGNLVSQLVKVPEDKGCKTKLEDADFFFDYSFEVKNKITISSPYLEQQDYEQCLKGNTLTFEFNAAEGTFDLLQITWDRTK